MLFPILQKAADSLTCLVHEFVNTQLWAVMETGQFWNVVGMWINVKQFQYFSSLGVGIVEGPIFRSVRNLGGKRDFLVPKILYAIQSEVNLSKLAVLFRGQICFCASIRGSDSRRLLQEVIFIDASLEVCRHQSKLCCEFIFGFSAFRPKLRCEFLFGLFPFRRLPEFPKRKRSQHNKTHCNGKSADYRLP